MSLHFPTRTRRRGCSRSAVTTVAADTRSSSRTGRTCTRRALSAIRAVLSRDTWQACQLIRLYSAHVVFIPGLIVVLATLHALLVTMHKISPHPALPSEGPGDQAPAAEPTEPFIHHLRRIGSFGLALLGVIGILAVVFPRGVGARPVQGIEVTEPPVNFWWLYSLENFFGLPPSSTPSWPSSACWSSSRSSTATRCASGGAARSP